MIDLGLAKLALIGAVALIVIGPEKLPKVARMAGSLLGRAQRYLHEVKAEVSRDIELEELRQMQQNVQQTASELTTSVAKQVKEVEQIIHSASSEPAVETLIHPPFTRKAREFRRKKQIRCASVPIWYKQQQGIKTRLLSASARVAKYRPKSTIS